MLGFPSLSALGIPPMSLNPCFKCSKLGLGLSIEAPSGFGLFPFHPCCWLLVPCLLPHRLLLAAAPPDFTSAFQAQKRRGSRPRELITEFCFVGLKNYFYGMPLPYRNALNLNVRFNRFLLSKCPCSQLWEKTELCQPRPLPQDPPPAPLSHSSLPPPEVTTPWTFLETTSLPFLVVVPAVSASLEGFLHLCALLSLSMHYFSLPLMMRPSSLSTLDTFSAHCFAGAVYVVNGWPTLSAMLRRCR